MTDQERRERLVNRPTRYELVAENGDRRVRIAYCARRGRRVLLDATRAHGADLIAFMGLDDSAQITFRKTASEGARIGDWRIRFTGRTQRECIGSELPWIGAEKKK